MVSRSMRILSMVVLLLAVQAMGEAESMEEKQKCMDELEGLVTCIPFLGGDANTPTQDCCTGFNHAIKNVNKCVCLVVKDRNDPQLGLKLNISLVLRLPHACKAPENFSQCPAILHLDPLSPEAQAFNEVNRTVVITSRRPTSSPPRPDEIRSDHMEKNEGKRLQVEEVVVAWLLINMAFYISP